MPKYATGGRISAPEPRDSDSVPLLVSRGGWYLSREEVAALGNRNLLELVNAVDPAEES